MSLTVWNLQQKVKKTLKLIERKLRENLSEKEKGSGVDCFSLGN